METSTNPDALPAGADRWRIVLLPGRICMDSQTGAATSTSMYVYYPDTLISPISTMEATMEKEGMTKTVAMASIRRRYRRESQPPPPPPPPSAAAAAAAAERVARELRD
jgi:hypothetical protein